MLCFVDSNVWKRVLDYIFRDAKEAGSFADVVLQKDVRLSWTKKVTNKEILKRVGKGRKLMKRMRKRQLEFLGHIMRKEKLENLP